MKPARAKLNWFSPVPPARTDIAHYTGRILDELRAGAEVSLWTADEKPPAEVDGLPVNHVQTLHERWPEVSFGDFSVYQLGNDPRFHGAFFRQLGQHGGVAVLHDLNCHEALRQHFLYGTHPEPRRYEAMLSAAGGAEAVDLARQIEHGGDLDALVDRFPLTRELLQGVHGVVTHNAANLPALEAGTRAPIQVLPLPFPARHVAPEPAPRAFSARAPLRVVMLGYLQSPNRRLHAVLEALAAFSRRECLRLELAGEIKEIDAFRAKIHELGIGDLVKFHGFLPEAALRDWLDAADLALNLRYPSRGEASGALLRLWEHAVPTVVTQTAYYATLPPETVAFVDPANEQADLHRHWAAMLDDPAPYVARGRAGRARLETVHQPRSYVAGLLDFLCGPVAAYRGRAFAEPMAARVARQTLAGWEDASARKYATARVAHELASWVG